MHIRIYPKSLNGAVSEPYNISLTKQETQQEIDLIIINEHKKLDRRCRGEYIIAVLVTVDEKLKTDIMEN